MAELYNLASLLGPIQLDAAGFTTNLKGWWKMDDVSGTTVTDSSGQSHTGTASRADINGGAAGKFLYSGTFVSASSDKVTITDHSDLKPTGNFTLLAWVKTSTTGVNQTIFQSRAQNTNYSGLMIRVTGSNVFQINSGRNTGTTANTDYKEVNGTKTVTDGLWHFIAATWNGSTLKIYTDGADEQSASWSNAPGYQATNYVRIGSRNNTGTDIDFMNGYIDDVQIINGTALTADQVSTLYGATAYWRFEGNSNDSKGSNNGTDTAITYGTN